ncbi:MAG: hypothetical protein JXQ73_21330 [Phycisphaerae bacterium]|nr:hypothetical protein [Phycisphaerae bacterium]
MFKRRLKFFLVLWTVALLAVIARLAELQVARGKELSAKAEELTLRAPRSIPPVRGRILDRHGELLASDEPTWDICIDYRALTSDEEYVRVLARRWRRTKRLAKYPGIEGPDESRRDEVAIAKKIEDSLSLVAELTDRPLDEILDRRQYILKRVAAIQRILVRSKGYYVEPGEMESLHPIVQGLDDQVAVKAKIALAGYDWLSVAASTRRIYRASPSLGHILGRLGQVTAEAKADDPFKDDRLRRYRDWETFGVAGVERLCESVLRGWRGEAERDYDNNEIGRTEPVDGKDAALTIDLALQERIYDLVGKAVKGFGSSTGGAAVVLHIPTRRILAMVSYPGFNPNTYREEFSKLIDDTRGRPTLFRAVAGVYPPGSVAKPVTLSVGLALNVITPETRLDCHGYLHNPLGRFKCWIYNKQHMGHNTAGFPAGLCAEEALQVSCNCYFYQVGEKIGGDRLCQWFRQFCIGPPPASGQVAGTGLIEERDPILPTAAWLWEHQRRAMYVGDSRNYAIGQGEMGLTPLHVASVMATVASGRFQWPTLVLDDARERPVWDLGLKPAHWRAVRNGLYRVVNVGTYPRGTAYNYAFMKEIPLAGKTGSAQCSRIVLSKRYVVEFPDGRREKIVAKHRAELDKKLEGQPGAKVISSRPYRLWPDSGRSATHAWFAGYVPGAPGDKPEYAFSVLIEFGDSGGHQAAPVAKEIVHALIDSPHAYLRAERSAQPSDAL